jgi:AcrR family transcriptional regulator
MIKGSELARVTKSREDRRIEIVQTAERLFREVGFAKCSVDMIIKDIGVAKGTFYYYFKSKEEILEAIVDRTLSKIMKMAEGVAADPAMTALEKMQALLSDSHVGDDTRDIAEMLHLPQNRELHEMTNVQTVLRMSPVFAEIVEQGNQEGVFATKRPLETIQFLFTGAQFLLDGGLFGFSDEETRVRREVAQEIIEKSLGAAPGSFEFMNPR